MAEAGTPVTTEETRERGLDSIRDYVQCGLWLDCPRGIWQGRGLVEKSQRSAEISAHCHMLILQSHLDLCDSLNELSKQEKTAELLPIGVQQLYVLSKLGKTEEAERIAEEISVQESRGTSS